MNRLSTGSLDEAFMKNFQQQSGIIKEIQDNPYLIEMATDKFGSSPRAYTRLSKVVRALDDLEGQENIQPAHLAEAISYRNP